MSAEDVDETLHDGKHCALHVGEDMCRAPSAARVGMRCSSGCYGEGVFEGACADHLADFREMVTADLADVECRCCDKVGTFTFFTIQELTRSEP